MKCEDFPCCGHSIGECPDYTQINTCGECGRKFHPDSENEEFCLSCNSKFKAKQYDEYIKDQKFKIFFKKLIVDLEAKEKRSKFKILKGNKK